MAACSACGQLLLRSVDAALDEKPVEMTVHTSACCGRQVCNPCANVSPFCPTQKRPLPTAPVPGKPPPAASQQEASRTASPPPPPPYTDADVVHHLRSTDTLPALSLLYSTPLPILRSYNRLYSDALLAARSHILIPASHYLGPSLSPSTTQSPRSTALARFQLASKCVDYDLANAYLDAADGQLDAALKQYAADEQWERAHGPAPSRVGQASSSNGKVGSAGLRRGFFQ
ncbi:hypothetical protein DRE_03510 [Drechslerella stenobrocha 248]|uniref:LysM domain-containing protein n=1 Tax=Drechslerella stenobrocha 248 TaxID=1043628 RepID=W7HSU1_9PEZI|nr:hypothetical protein DRE_03510 [Drechslerella stenobrocha 248]